MARALEQTKRSQSPATQRSTGSRLIARTSLVLLSYTAAAIVALHALRPDLSPAQHFVSEYALGALGGIMTSAFIAWGIGTLALALGLLRAAAPRGRSWVGSGLLLVWGSVLLVAATFPTDLPGAPETAAGAIHNQASLAGFLAVAVATPLISAAWRKEPRWRPLMRAGLLLSALIGVGLVLLVAMIVGSSDRVGVAQRLLIGANLMWSLLVARRLLLLER